METARCPVCHKTTQTRAVGALRVLVTHLNVGIYCHGSKLLATTDADIRAIVAADMLARQ